MQEQSKRYRHSDIILSQNGNNVWLGDFASAENKQDLKKKNIKTVVTCMDDCKIKYEDNIRHFFFQLKDLKSQNISQYFTKCSRFIKEGLKTGSVLVHCGAGVSRSTTFVIAYLMKQKNMTFHQALKLVKSKRPQVCPNLGFQMQLKFYQRCLNADTANKNSKLSLLKLRHTSPSDNFAKYSLNTIYGPKRNQSLVSKRNTLQVSKIGFRITLKQFRG